MKIMQPTHSKYMCLSMNMPWMLHPSEAPLCFPPLVLWHLEQRSKSLACPCKALHDLSPVTSLSSHSFHFLFFAHWPQWPSFYSPKTLCSLPPRNICSHYFFPPWNILSCTTSSSHHLLNKVLLNLQIFT